MDSASDDEAVVQVEIRSVDNSSRLTAVPLAAIKQSDFYTSYLTQFDTATSVPFPLDYNSIADNYLNYLNAQSVLTAKQLLKTLQLTHLLGDRGYLKHLVKDVLLLNWRQYSSVLPQLHNQLQVEVCLYLPLSLIPSEQLARSKTLIDQWLEVNRLPGTSLSPLVHQQQQAVIVPIITSNPAAIYNYTVTVDVETSITTDNSVVSSNGYCITEKCSDGCCLVGKWSSVTIVSESRFISLDGYNLEHGLQRRWYASTDSSKPPQIAEQYNCHKGNKEEVYHRWHLSGGKSSEIPYSNGLVCGVAYRWYDNATNSPKEEIGCHLGWSNRHGIYRTWNEAGIMTTDGIYDNGKRHGEWREWSDSGELQFHVTYEQGNAAATHVDKNANIVAYSWNGLGLSTTSLGNYPYQGAVNVVTNTLNINQHQTVGINNMLHTRNLIVDPNYVVVITNQ